jgi:hypothetical protein
MTKDAKGRGNATPPDLSKYMSDEEWERIRNETREKFSDEEWRALLEDVRNAYYWAEHGNRIRFFERENPIYAWLEIGSVWRAWQRAKIKAAEQGLSEPALPVLPEWCFSYLANCAESIADCAIWRGTGMGSYREHMFWKQRFSHLFNRTSPLTEKEQQELMGYFKGLNKSTSREVRAVDGKDMLPAFLGFVDDGGFNAFLDYWSAKKREDVAAFVHMNKREGKSQSEIYEFIADRLGISDPRTIRRYAKEGRGEGGNRTRRKKRQTPPDRPAKK